MPHNAIVGEWITATPTAENVATAAALNIQATRAVDELGRPTSTPFHWIVITATPTPLPTSTPTIPPVIFSADFTPTPIPTATEFIPASLPDEYRNLVFFQRGAGAGAETWLVNPATGETGRVTREWIYPMARRSLTLSPNGTEEVFVRSNADGIPEIYIRAVGSTRERKLTDFSRPSYDPAWSPTGEWISFVSSNSGNDEIYRVSPDGAVLQQLTHNNWEWDKHPSWSPDGSQIVFFSNRDVGRTQIWIMNADGSGQRRLVESEAEDMYPVWAR
jgi:Tol biopolymer transport system component